MPEGALAPQRRKWVVSNLPRGACERARKRLWRTDVKHEIMRRANDVAEYLETLRRDEKRKKREANKERLEAEMEDAELISLAALGY